MATLKTKFSVGLFLIIGVALAIMGIIWLGMSNYLEKGRLFVAYFDESVQGLDVDSPVKYRGVHIGRVHSIGVAPDDRLIQVVVKIETDVQPEGLNPTNLIAKLKSVGITGLMFIELEHQQEPVSKAETTFSFKPEYPVIATRPSEISKFFQGIEDVFNMFRALDARTISDQMVMALKKINQTIDSAQLTPLLEDLRAAVQNMQKMLNSEKVIRLLASAEKTANSFDQMAVNANGGISEIRATVSHLDKVVTNGGGDMAAISADLKSAAQQVKTATENAAALLQSTDQRVDALQREAMMTLNRMEQATDSLNRFLDRLSSQPSQVVFSAPAVGKP
jgi:phospholipid/cholesterol/gamma-HCH transport system substrate-binding protein